MRGCNASLNVLVALGEILLHLAVLSRLMGFVTCWESLFGCKVAYSSAEWASRRGSSADPGCLLVVQLRHQEEGRAGARGEGQPLVPPALEASLVVCVDCGM